MFHVVIERGFDFWRTAARRLLAHNVSPEAVVWSEADAAGLLPGFAAAAEGDPSPGHPAPPLSVPARFIALARLVACHRDAGRWELLYRTLWRLTRGGERHLLHLVTDDDVRRLAGMERDVRRDRHKMTAFVRFRRVEREGGEWYVAWHRPDHFIVRLTAPFFARRFAAMRWAILTPDESVAWDESALRFGPGVPAAGAPAADALQDLWLAYYANTFNPARVNVAAMKRELPVRHWPTLPEAELIPQLLRDAPRRVEEMMAAQRRSAAKPAGRVPRRTPAARPDAPEPAAPPTAGEKAACETATSAAAFLPAKLELPLLQEAARGCRGCGIYCNATQTVFGEGPRAATLMFVGEQPGDQEDKAGRPFVGPSGQLLNEALHQAGIPRDECYVTNAVKHFKFEPRGPRRIHAKPSAREVAACRPWLEAEIQVVKPQMIVCLGATAAQSLLGRDFRVTQHRGEILESEWAPALLATVHPSSLLRIPDETMREQAYGQFLDDLKVVARRLK